MDKLVIKTVIALLVLGGFKMIVVESDKPHTFEVTLGTFTTIIAFFEMIEEVAKDIETVLKL